ncbi:MAG: DUF2852 domain-containing protein [Hyphomicrobiales bacterium]|nr:DUF2852 domain-containing protein [Hyphomicrobiales bacterium]MDE2114532.1 DUF2852 domain-containing protein [Hyphomicrobiales bacterium]
MSQYQDIRGHRCHSISGRRRWSAIELLAMVLGFVFFWPIGLAILALKIWQKRTDHPGDLVDAAQGLAASGKEWARSKMSGEMQRKWDQGRTTWSQAGTPTGNTAFDDWRTGEIAKLEEQRAKLVQAERDFAEHIDGLRRARDREAFDQFMAARNRPVSNPDATNG